MAVLFTKSEVAAYYASRVPSLVQGPGWKWRGPCPIHRGAGDNWAVDRESGQWYCHGKCKCGGDILDLEQRLTGADFKTAKAEVFRLVGRSESEFSGHANRTNGISADTAHPNPPEPTGTADVWHEIARYPYVDRDGNLLFEVVRQERGKGGEHDKKFLQRRPDGVGGWIWDVNGVDRVPYRLPRLLGAETVYLPEGEKDVHTLESWGLVASCNPGGSGGGHLYAQWAGYFQGKHIVIPFDYDEPGRKHAIAKAAALLAVAASVRIVELPGLADKGDVTDWRDAGGTGAQLRTLTAGTVPLDAAALSELRQQWRLVDEHSHHTVAQEELPEEWPQPQVLQGDLPPVQTLCEELLPASFRPLVRDVSERMQVPNDLPAVVMTACLAGVVNRRAVIQPKASDTSWVVVPNLWGGIITPPGFMKSPVIQVATRAVNQIQTEWRQEQEEALQEYALAKEECELRLGVWKQDYKKHTKKGTAAPDRPKDEAEEPKLRRLIVNDATFEAMHETMSENPAGILVIRDELTGWWSQLDRAGREGERAFCLQAWNGDTGHTIDRIGRGTIHVPACCMSMVGGIQPGRLRSYLVDTLQDGPSNDGLPQRFQLLVWPDPPLQWLYVDRPPDVAAEQMVEGVFRKLVELDAENPACFRFAPDAQELFVEWLAELEAKIRGEELHPALISHLSKYRSLMPSLALLFELSTSCSATLKLNQAHAVVCCDKLGTTKFYLCWVKVSWGEV